MLTATVGLVTPPSTCWVTMASEVKLLTATAAPPAPDASESASDSWMPWIVMFPSALIHTALVLSLPMFTASSGLVVALAVPLVTVTAPPPEVLIVARLLASPSAEAVSAPDTLMTVVRSPRVRKTFGVASVSDDPLLTETSPPPVLATEPTASARS